jgi:hypothetical protein
MREAERRRKEKIALKKLIEAAESIIARHERGEPAGMSVLEISEEMIEIERRILGDILIDNRQIEHFPISNQSFYHEPHKIIFDAMVLVKFGGLQIDIVTLAEELKSFKNLERVGGVAYLAKLTDLGSLKGENDALQ